MPANQVIEEVVEEEPQPPPARKRKLEASANHMESGDTVGGGDTFSLVQHIELICFCHLTGF